MIGSVTCKKTNVILFPMLNRHRVSQCATYDLWGLSFQWRMYEDCKTKSLNINHSATIPAR